jgi:hypothetical protein
MRRVGEEHHVGEMRRVGEMCIGEGRTSARPSSPTAGDGDARASGRSSASERSLSSGTSAARIGNGDDDGGREAGRRFGGKRLSADLEGDVAYVEPPTFCHGSYSQP